MLVISTKDVEKAPILDPEGLYDCPRCGQDHQLRTDTSPAYDPPSNPPPLLWVRCEHDGEEKTYVAGLWHEDGTYRRLL